MRRAVIAVALVILCLVAGVALWRGSQERLVEPAQLVPAETLLLADFPDLPATAIRWKETELYALCQEPQVQGFLAKPLAALQHNESWTGTLRSLERIQPQRAFLAVVSVTNNMPRAVGGFAYKEDRAEVERLITSARKQFQSASPEGKLERLKHRDFHIESFSEKGITLAGCFARHWYFVANDVELLKATLDRFSGKTHAALDSAPAYQQSLAVLPPHADFRLFTQPGAISERLLARLNASGQLFDPRESAALGKLRSVALASRLEGKRMRGALFLYEPEMPPRPVLNGKTLSLTTSNTLFYAAMAPLISDEPLQRGNPQVFPSLIPMRTLLAALNSPPATLAQFKTAFGPEHALLLDWPVGGGAPNLFLVCEIRDPAEARRFMENVFRAWNRADAEGVSFWTLSVDDPTMAQFHPTVALTAHHLLAGLSPESLKPFASNAVHPPGAGATLERSVAYQGAMGTLPKPQIGFAYLDAKPVFERIYSFLRPAAILWGNGIANMNGTLDFTQLPTPEVIAGHLSPMGLSAVQTESGILLESTGPISFLELGEVLGAAAVGVALPSLGGEPFPLPRKRLPGILPPAPTTPLSAPGKDPASAAAPEGPPEALN
ncbi:MAG: hypothetical protein NTZ46_04200 [Verrucomicrobia bacterium]|nr:hypothetical protein [Verrucomicrobiota bacterium]